MEEDQDCPKNNSTLSLEEYVALTLCAIVTAIFNTNFSHTNTPHYRYLTPTMSTAPKSFAEQPEAKGQSSDREILSFNTQQLINDINNKRKRDSSLVLGEIEINVDYFC